MNVEATTAKMLLHIIFSQWTLLHTIKCSQASSWKESLWGQEVHPYTTHPSRDETERDLSWWSCSAERGSCGALGHRADPVMLRVEGRPS